MLYHRDITLPSELKQYLGQTFKLRLTHHARQSCLNDRYGFISVPESVTLGHSNIIEVELNERRQVIKIVARVSSGINDVCIAFIPEIGVHEGIVKTVWLNEASDAHETLRRERYANA